MYEQGLRSTYFYIYLSASHYNLLQLLRRRLLDKIRLWRVKVRRDELTLKDRLAGLQDQFDQLWNRILQLSYKVGCFL